jgi:hypothetical protein
MSPKLLLPASRAITASIAAHCWIAIQFARLALSGQVLTIGDVVAPVGLRIGLVEWSNWVRKMLELVWR